MLVKEIIKKVANYTNNFELYNALNSGTINTKEREEVNLLVDCVNLTNVNIATNYFRLIDTKEVSNLNGTLNYSKITNHTIFEIISVKNSNKEKLDYMITKDGIITTKGMLSVKYSYFPDNLSYEDEILNYPTNISERSFVYGVISEYLYVKGVFDEAQMWEEKFKLEMQNLKRSQKQFKVKKRSWY